MSFGRKIYFIKDRELLVLSSAYRTLLVFSMSFHTKLTVAK